jgi:hypothetical protein
LVNNNKQTGDAVCPVYQCALPLSSNTVNYVADLLRAHLKAIGSRWRSRSAGQIAVLVLAVLRHGQRAADLAGGNAVSATTIRRWCDEVIALLAAKAPRLDRALKKITRAGGEVVLLDGTLIRTRRPAGKANRKNYSGKHKSHGLLFLALTDERGNLIWISSARRGAASEIKTARHDKICQHLRTAGLGVPISASSASIPTATTRWSSPGPSGPARRSSPPTRRPPTRSSPPPAPPSSTASPR